VKTNGNNHLMKLKQKDKKKDKNDIGCGMRGRKKTGDEASHGKQLYLRPCGRLKHKKKTKEKQKNKANNKTNEN